jgi:polyisoprenoid-binding protein YceI
VLGFELYKTMLVLEDKMLLKKISTFVLAAVFLGLTSIGHAAVYNIDPSHSQVGFKIRHIVSKVKGKFNDFSGTVDFDPAKIEKTKASVIIKTASVDTDQEKRDAHLKSPDFFNVEKFPELKFEGNKAEKVSNEKFKLMGDLTLLGVTKPVTLDVEIGGVGNDPWGNIRSGFSATGKINRKDFGMVFNIAIDKGGYVLGDEVEILIELEAIQKK